MKLSIILRTSENRGDHAADVARALKPIDGQTVEELAKRNLTRLDKGHYRKDADGKYGYHDQKIVARDGEWIEIRIEQEQDDEPKIPPDVPDDDLGFKQ